MKNLKLGHSMNEDFKIECLDNATVYIYNPYHYLVILGLQRSGVNIHSLIIPSKLNSELVNLPDIKSGKKIIISDSFKSNSLLKRIYSFFKNFYTFLKVSNDGPLIVANDRSLLVSIALRFSRVNSMVLLDEGALSQILFREKAINLESFRYRSLIDRILGRYPRCEHPKTSYILTEDSSLINNVDFSADKIISIKSFVSYSLRYLYSGLDLKVNDLSSSFLLVTSPLTENGNNGNSSELEIIDKLLRYNPNETFYWSRHYRESQNKYDEIFMKYNNFIRLDDSISYLPGQIIANSFQCLIGFHSSLLVHTAKNKKKVFSLSSLVDSQHARLFVDSSPENIEFLYAYEIPNSNS